MKKLDKIIKTSDGVIEKLTEGFKLRVPNGATHYGYLLKFFDKGKKEVIFVPITLIDEMIKDGILDFSKLTSFCHYYKLKETE